jgi:cyclic pyranopterin phosphate synthase
LDKRPGKDMAPMEPKRSLPLFPAAQPAGRLASYRLRVSLLEQCQYRCPYCMPGAVNPYTPRADWLTVEEHARLAPFFERRGVEQVRFTGGEPLLREDVAEIVAAWRLGLPDAQFALTTNGQRLASWMEPLKNAGMDRITVHMDALEPEAYRRLMGEGATPQEIIDVIKEAKKLFSEVKINVVAQKGENDHAFIDFLEMAAAIGVQVRFIELMNTGSAADYVKKTFMSGREILARIQENAPVESVGRAHPSDPASLFRLVKGGTLFGVIASDTEPFCDSCNRLRLTAQGRLRGCLYESGGAPLGPVLRAAARDAVIDALLDSALLDKRSYHPLASPQRVPFSMADVGG